MPEMTRNGELCGEMAEIREHIREQGERHGDALEKIHRLLENLTANSQYQN